MKFIEADNEGYWILLNDIPEPNQENETCTIRIPQDETAFRHSIEMKYQAM